MYYFDFELCEYSKSIQRLKNSENYGLVPSFVIIPLFIGAPHYNKNIQNIKKKSVSWGYCHSHTQGGSPVQAH